MLVVRYVLIKIKEKSIEKSVVSFIYSIDWYNNISVLFILFYKLIFFSQICDIVLTFIFCNDQVCKFTIHFAGPVQQMLQYEIQIGIPGKHRFSCLCLMLSSTHER